MRNGLMIVLTSLCIVSYSYADVSVCPKTSDIKASAFTSPDTPAPYNEGFKYEAPASGGKKWEGETMATSDTFLEPKYELKPLSVEEQPSKTICSYGGKTIEQNGEKSTPYLKMTLAK